MNKKLYNAPLTYADLMMVGMGQVMVNSTDPAAKIGESGNATGKLGKQYV